MTVEELLEKVNGKVDTKKFKSLSKKTIDEELNDVLDEIGDDDAVNDRIITKLANRLKRMDGNLHKNVSDEIKKSKEEAERKAKEEKEAKEKEAKEKEEEEKKNNPESNELIKKLTDRLYAMEKANKERETKEAMKATMDAVKNGLKEKFEKAGLEMKNYFLKAAISKLEIPNEDVDIDDLVSKAEKIYTTEYKEATGENGIPRKGQPRTSGSDSEEDKLLDEIAKRRKEKYGDGGAKK